MKFKLLITVSVLGLAIVFGLSYFSSKGRVYIDISNVSDDAEMLLVIHNSDNSTTTKRVINKSAVQLSSGTYTISLQNENNSVIKSVTVPSFLRTTTLSEPLVNEQKRTFVGTNPSPCMLYVMGTFYSLACGDDTSTLEQQIAPTLSTPGYTVVPSSNLVGTVLGTSATNTDTYVLLENYTDEGSIQELVQVGSDLSVVKTLEIPTFSTSDLAITADSKRVLVYSATDKVGYVYDESTGSLKKISLPNADSKYVLKDVSLLNSRLVTTYSESEENDQVDGGTVAAGSSKIFVQEFGKKTAEYATPRPYSKTTYCAPETLCAVNADGLEVVSIQDESLRKVATLPGVTDMFNSGDTIRFIDTTGIKTFDLETSTGHYEYTFGGFTSCGVSSSVSGYIACVIDTKNQKHALFISTQNKAGKDDVDKKVLDILKSNVVSGVAAVNNYIYVIPDYGDVGIFTQDKETTSRINQAIDSVIRKSTIPKESYFVINAGNPL